MYGRISSTVEERKMLFRTYRSETDVRAARRAHGSTWQEIQEIPVCSTDLNPRPTDLVGRLQTRQQRAMNLSHTPCSCHAAERRQQVIPLLQTSSCGKSSQAMPVFSTNKMPVSTVWSPSGFRLGKRLRRRFGGANKRLIISHNLSSEIGYHMSAPRCAASNGNCNS